LTALNERQREVLRHPGPQLRAFVRTEWLKAIIGICAGVLAGLLEELLLRDRAFEAFIAKKWSPVSSQQWFDHSLSYGSYLVVLGLVIVVAGVIRVAPLLYRILKSLARGVVSGVTVFWAIPFFALLDYGAPPRFHEILLSLGTSSALSIVSFILYLCAELMSRRDQKAISAYSGVVGQSSLAENRWPDSISDSPIGEWEQDILNRSAFVESLISAIMVSKAPVIAIHGAYGDGKTSVLHLLGKSLKGHAVVVPFITWLPGSQDNLAVEVFESIATECKRHYYVPQLRKRSLAYAKSLCEAVPYGKAFSDLLPSTSQEEDIEDLGSSLRRLPRRIVVLLDEMDRMQEEELRILLKVIRGVSAFPNLSYVCALNRLAVENILPKIDGVEKHEYFEKFFPATFELPRVDSGLLFRLFSTKLDKVHIHSGAKMRGRNSMKVSERSGTIPWSGCAQTYEKSLSYLMM
jgi:KAP family P-loop domain